MNANSSFACREAVDLLAVARLKVSFFAASRNSSYVQLPSFGGGDAALLE